MGSRHTFPNLGRRGRGQQSLGSPDDMHSAGPRTCPVWPTPSPRLTYASARSPVPAPPCPLPRGSGADASL